MVTGNQDIDIQHRSLAVPALVVYSGLLLVALVWTGLRASGPRVWDLPPSLSAGLVHLLAGAGAALVVLAFSEYGRRHWGWAQGLETEFRGLLGRLTGVEVLVLAVTSGLAEEAFFRGALQTAFHRPELGIPAASLLFGVLHNTGRPGMWTWTAFATILGAGLGVLYYWTGDLIAPVTAHFAINFVNLHRISGWWAEPAAVP